MWCSSGSYGSLDALEVVEQSQVEQLFELYRPDLGMLRVLQWGEIRGVGEPVARVLSFVASFVAFLWLCILPVHSHIFLHDALVLWPRQTHLNRCKPLDISESILNPMWAYASGERTRLACSGSRPRAPHP
jgi:hypothetical protein